MRAMRTTTPIALALLLFACELPVPTRPRAYDPIEGRQQSADRLVASVDELRSMLEEAAGAGTPLHARLAADMELDTGITIPAEVPTFTLNGGGHAIIFTAPIENVITFAGATAHLFEDVTFTARGVAANVATSLLQHQGSGLDDFGFHLRGVVVDDVTHILGDDGQWKYGEAIACVFGTGTTLDRDVYGSTFVDCLFDSVDFATSFAANNTLVGCTIATAYTGGTEHNALVGTLFLGLASGLSFSDAETYLGVMDNLAGVTALVPFGVAYGSFDVSANGANPTLAFNHASKLRLTIAGTATGNITLPAGVFDGQQLQIIAVSVVGTATIPDATTQRVRLSAAWAPGQWDTLSLVWDETDGNWIETARSNN
jgi:hypothetical protein